MITTAGRLLSALAESGPLPLREVARHLGIPLQTLEGCRQGEGALAPEQQVALAELVLALAPEHVRAARKLRGQAMAAAAFGAREPESPTATRPGWPS